MYGDPFVWDTAELSSSGPPSPPNHRFPDGFEKFSPPILQLDEVDFYYDSNNYIFRGLSVSADLESRICVVRTTHLAGMGQWEDAPQRSCQMLELGSSV